MYTVKTKAGQICTVVMYYDMAIRWIEAHIDEVAPNDIWMLVCFGNPEKQIRVRKDGAM